MLWPFPGISQSWGRGTLEASGWEEEEEDGEAGWRMRREGETWQKVMKGIWGLASALPWEGRMLTVNHGDPGHIGYAMLHCAVLCHAGVCQCC